MMNPNIEVKKPSKPCPLCGHPIDLESRSCSSACPLSHHCNLVCCPHCGYSFPKESRTVEFFKGLLNKRRSHERPS